MYWERWGLSLRLFIIVIKGTEPQCPPVGWNQPLKARKLINKEISMYLQRAFYKYLWDILFLLPPPPKLKPTEESLYVGEVLLMLECDTLNNVKGRQDCETSDW